MSEAKHTALPWRVDLVYETHNHPTRYWEVSIRSGEEIVAYAAGATQEEAEANAALIVRAVNCHDELVRSLGLARAFIGEDEPHISKPIAAALARWQGAEEKS